MRPFYWKSCLCAILARSLCSVASGALDTAMFSHVRRIKCWHSHFGNALIVKYGGRWGEREETAKERRDGERQETRKPERVSLWRIGNSVLDTEMEIYSICLCRYSERKCKRQAKGLIWRVAFRVRT